jgi:hypothetical protein
VRGVVVGAGDGGEQVADLADGQVLHGQVPAHVGGQVLGEGLVDAGELEAALSFRRGATPSTSAGSSYRSPRSSKSASRKKVRTFIGVVLLHDSAIAVRGTARGRSADRLPWQGRNVR